MYRIDLKVEEGTIWWHAHSQWARATVHGAFIVYPKRGSSYPFPKPHREIPLILGTLASMWMRLVHDCVTCCDI